MGEDNQWYTNKELFEQVNALKFELRETTSIIKKYNGLREDMVNMRNDIKNVKADVNRIKATSTSKKTISDSVRNWLTFTISLGGWIVAIIALFN